MNGKVTITMEIHDGIVLMKAKAQLSMIGGITVKSTQMMMQMNDGFVLMTLDNTQTMNHLQVTHTTKMVEDQTMSMTTETMMTMETMMTTMRLIILHY